MGSPLQEQCLWRFDWVIKGDKLNKFSDRYNYYQVRVAGAPRDLRPGALHHGRHDHG